METRYELWDRFTGNLILDFTDRGSALAFVRDQVGDLDAADAEQEVARMALVRIAQGETEVLAEASSLRALILAPAPN